MTVTAKVLNLKDVSDFIKGLPADAFTEMKTQTAKSLLEADANIKEKTDLERRSGNLMKSIQTRIEGTNFSNFSASIFTDTVYAPIQEEGGTIKAKNAYKGVPGGPYLNIPAAANKTAAGVMRMSAKEVFTRGGYIVGRTVVLAGATMFYLVKSVDVPARLNMVSSVEEVVPTLLSRLRDNLGE